VSVAVGALVRARGREWVVQPGSDDDFLLLQPLGGGPDDVTGVFSDEGVEPATFPLPADWASNYKAAASKMNCADVLDSALLLLPENVQVHGGNQLIMKGGPDEMLVQQWVTQP
jgi:hypothetical protein